MAKAPIEQHLADFWKQIKTDEYRRQLKPFWIEHYGQHVFDKMMAIINTPKRK